MKSSVLFLLLGCLLPSTCCFATNLGGSLGYVRDQETKSNGIQTGIYYSTYDLEVDRGGSKVSLAYSNFGNSSDLDDFWMISLKFAVTFSADITKKFTFLPEVGPNLNYVTYQFNDSTSLSPTRTVVRALDYGLYAAIPFVYQCTPSFQIAFSPASVDFVFNSSDHTGPRGSGFKIVYSAHADVGFSF